MQKKETKDRHSEGKNLIHTFPFIVLRCVAQHSLTTRSVALDCHGNLQLHFSGSGCNAVAQNVTSESGTERECYQVLKQQAEQGKQMQAH